MAPRHAAARVLAKTSPGARRHLCRTSSPSAAPRACALTHTFSPSLSPTLGLKLLVFAEVRVCGVGRGGCSLASGHAPHLPQSLTPLLCSAVLFASRVCTCGCCSEHYMWLRRHFGLEKASLHTKCQKGVIPRRCAALLEQFEANGIRFPVTPANATALPPRSSQHLRHAAGAASPAGCQHKPQQQQKQKAQRHHHHRQATPTPPRPVAAAPNRAPRGRSAPVASSEPVPRPFDVVGNDMFDNEVSPGMARTMSMASSDMSTYEEEEFPLTRPFSPFNDMMGDEDAFATLDFDLLDSACSPGVGADDDVMMDSLGMELELQAAERARAAARRADECAAAIQQRAAAARSAGAGVGVGASPPALPPTHRHHHHYAASNNNNNNNNSNKRSRPAHGLPMYTPTTAKVTNVPPLLKPGKVPRHHLHSRRMPVRPTQRQRQHQQQQHHHHHQFGSGRALSAARPVVTPGLAREAVSSASSGEYDAVPTGAAALSSAPPPSSHAQHAMSLDQPGAESALLGWAPVSAGALTPASFLADEPLPDIQDGAYAALKQPQQPQPLQVGPAVVALKTEPAAVFAVATTSTCAGPQGVTHPTSAGGVREGDDDDTLAALGDLSDLDSLGETDFVWDTLGDAATAAGGKATMCSKDDFTPLFLGVETTTLS